MTKVGLNLYRLQLRIPLGHTATNEHLYPKPLPIFPTPSQGTNIEEGAERLKEPGVRKDWTKQFLLDITRSLY